jgi:NAD(P)-dependent dehydrogenase (short-subunit alcohol dehydrogenase family)/acyl carrier protein
MLRYLGETNPSPRVSTLAVVESRPALPQTKAANSANTASSPGPKLTPLEALVATVSERTGYPADMLDPDLDLEADLGIDSIKRIEILGEMRDKLGLEVGGEAGDAMVEKLAAVKTLRGIAELLEAALDPQEAPDSARVEVPAPPSSSVQLIATVSPPAMVGRYVVEIESVPPPSSSTAKIAGKQFAIVPDALGVAGKLAELLRANGAYARILNDADAIAEGEGLVYLETISTKAPGAVRGLFVRAQEATKAKGEWVLAATGLGGWFGHHAHARIASPDAAGVSGLLKSLAKERHDLRVRAVDLDAREDPARLARHVFDELVADDAYVEVGYYRGERNTLIVAARPSSMPPPSPLEIDDSSVVLFTGGARGITAQIAIAMARRFRCTLELVGRSPLLDDEDAELRAASDAVGLRKLLIARINGAGPASPAAIDAHCKQILAAREVRETLDAIRAAGGRVDYHAVDVRDDAAFGTLIDQLRAKHGRIDGVVHGAGLIEDKLLRDKTHESFDRVFSTKVAGARTLARKLADETRFFVFFSSVSGAFGNRGQTDYAAANDVLDKLAHHLHETVRGRVLSINWGPWRGVGMVRPELEREYERRGIGLIQPRDGIDRFFEELLAGSDPQVILTATHAEALT